MPKTRKLATVFSIFLIVSVLASATLMQSALAHDPPQQITTHAFIHAVPNPVGVGQTVNVFMFLTNYYYGAAITNDLRFHNYKLTITAPDGQITTQEFSTVIDTTSNQMAKFVPDQVGTYSLKFDYPGETYTSTLPIGVALGAPVGPNPYTNDTFTPSSASTTISVQQEQIPPAIASYPLPTEYWDRPIYGENSYWYTISSNWLGIGSPNYGGYSNLGDASGGQANGEAMFPGDAIGPQTSHIMWTKPLQSGGVVGGQNFEILGDTFFDGSAYLIRYNNPIILAGKLYYTEAVSFSSTGYRVSAISNGYGPTVCVDLRTGEKIWSLTDVPPLSHGLIFDVQTANEHGVCPPVLIAVSGTTWMGYDGDSGKWLFNATNIPAIGAGKAMGSNGEFLNYVIANAGNTSNPDYRLGQWNSSKLFFARNALAPTMLGIKDASISNQNDPNCRYDWNVSLGSYFNTMKTPFTITNAKYKDGILCYNGTMPSNGENRLFPTYSQAPYTYFFINLNPSKGAIGSISWSKTIDPALSNVTIIPSGADFDTRVFIESCKETVQWIGYNLDSGAKIWGPTKPQEAFDYYGSPSAGILSGQIAYEKLYSCAMAGILYCYDIKTGNLLWTYGNGGEGNSTNSGLNWPYGNIPTFVNAIGNDVVYLITSEHTWTTPIYKGGLARAVNATDGTELWTISSVTMEFGQTSYAIADGFATWFNGYDNQIYVVGRGPSAITVTAPDLAAAPGQRVVIRGTVTDAASGTTSDEQKARFPSGVPVASDASMKDWMGYVYQQKPLPTNFTGVPVIIDVLDSNNNYRPIGTAITDANGQFSMSWLPDIPGDFKVVARFAGTNGYWPSYAETSFAVDAETAPTPTQTTDLINSDNTQMYVIGVGAAIIIAIAIVGALIMMTLRKRP